MIAMDPSRPTARLRRLVSEFGHYLKFVAIGCIGMCPSRRGLEVARRGYVASLDGWSPIPAVPFSRLVPSRRSKPNLSLRLLAGTQGGGSINVFESFLLSSLVKMVAPRAILEIGTFRGGTTWHLFHNASPETIIYTFDLPDGAIPEAITDRELAATRTREFIPDSPRVKLRLVDTKAWDGTLESKVQFAFIDGDHSYEGVRNDTEKAMRQLDEDGCICWHDCLGRDYGYGVHRYLVRLRRRGLRIFRVKGVHEISSLAIWMTPACEERLGVLTPDVAGFRRER